MSRASRSVLRIKLQRLLILSALALLLAVTADVSDAAAQTITFDSASSSSGNTVTSLTWAHTIGAGTDRILIVGVSIRGNKTVTGLTYGGQALTLAGTVANGGSNAVEMWALVAPPSG